MTEQAGEATTKVLELKNVVAGYGELDVLHGISLEVARGEVVFVIGPNGAGKSTLLRVLSGELGIRSGEMHWCDERIRAWRPHVAARRGLVHVPEGRGMLGHLTVAENMIVAAQIGQARGGSGDWREVLQRFPELSSRLPQHAGSLSGGEQQMLAIARGLIAEPVLLVLDEPTMGLAPQIVERVRDLLLQLRDESRTVLLIEQNAQVALSVGLRGYVLENGKIAHSGDVSEFLEDDELLRAYFGAGAS